jgi:Kef-type K+ transport system membrane component KefB
MFDYHILQSIGWIIVAGGVLALAARRLKTPSLVAYVVAGLVLGPIFGLVTVDEGLEIISEVGIVLLLFLVGLELSLDNIKDVGKVALIAGLGQITLTFAGGLGLATLLGFEFIDAVFLGVALTFSSTVVVVKLLDQKGDLDSLYGRIAVGIFLVQDMVVIVALTFLIAFGQQGQEASMGDLAASLGLAFGGTIALLAAAILASRYVLPRPFAWASRSPQTVLIWSLCWCFLFVIASELMHLSIEIGAFLAGLSLAQLPYTGDLRRRVHPLMSFFIAIFLVTLGIGMDLGAAWEYAGSAVALSVFVLLGKGLMFVWIISRQGYGERTSFLTSVTVAQISEFSFIFAAMGVSAGLVDESLLALITVVGLVTIVISAYMIIYNEQLFELVRPTGWLGWLGANEESDAAQEAEPLSDHVIVVGMNALGRSLVERLDQRGVEVVAIDTDPAKLDGLPGEGVLSNAEFASTMQEAGLQRARLLVSALRIEETNRILAYRAHRAGVPASIHAFDKSVIDDLRKLDIDHLLESKENASRLQLEHLRDAPGGRR